MKGVFEGFGGNFSDFKYNTPDHSKLAALERSVYQFAGAKNWQMLRELTGSLKEGDRVLPFKEWEAKAKQIIGGEYEGKYKRVEYNTAIGSSQMASKCLEYDKHPDDLIEYVDAQDDRECPICRGFRGTILPWDHPFWRTAMPLNHFGCHCSTRRHSSGTRTPEADIPGFERIPSMFRTNIAEKGLVYPEGHAYYIGCPKEVLEHAMSMLPYERRFEPIYESKIKNALGHYGQVLRHVDVNTVNSDNNHYNLHLQIAKEKADMGHVVELLPELVRADKNRELLLPGVKENKNPDLRIDGEYVEVKQPVPPYGRNTIANAISEAASQADEVVVNILDDKISELTLYRAANGKMNQLEKLRSVEFRHRGKYLVITKKQGS